MKEKLSQFWQGWKKVGQVIGDFIARVILSLFYFTIFVPFALVIQLSRDPLGLKSPNSGWLDRANRKITLEDLRKQS